MANSKISELPVADTMTGSEIVCVVQNGITKKAPVSGLNTGFDSSNRLLGKLISADFNTTADQIIPLAGGTMYVINDILITNARINITTATGIWIVTTFPMYGMAGYYPVAKYSGDLSTWLTAPSGIFRNTMELSTPFMAEQVTAPGPSLSFSLGTPQGAEARADIYVFGFVLK